MPVSSGMYTPDILETLEFVTFKDKDVAQNLIKKFMVVTVNVRKTDIKKADLKQGGPSLGGPPRVPGFSKPGMHHW